MQRNKPTAFTLIEMLTVVSVLLLLVLILLPTFNSVRERARIVTCSSQLHSLAAAELSYVLDNRQKFTTCRHWAGPYGPAPAGQISNNYNDEADWYADPNGSTSTRGGPRNGQLWPYVQNDQTYLCSSFKSIVTLMNLVYPLRSYSQNINIWGPEVPQTSQDGAVQGDTSRYTSIGMVQNPSEMLLFGEENPYNVVIRSASSNSPLNDCVWRGSYTRAGATTTTGMNTMATYHSFTTVSEGADVTWRPGGGVTTRLPPGYAFGSGNYVAVGGNVELVPWNYRAKPESPDRPDYTNLLFNVGDPRCAPW